MAHQLFQLPRPTAISNNLTLVAGAKVSFFLTGTSTPTNTYQDSALTTPHTNPVVADSAGRFPAIYLDPEVIYRVTFTDSADVEIYPAIDPANDQILSQSVIGRLLYPRTSAEIAAGVTPTNYQYPECTVLRYGTNTVPGTTDMTTAIQSALNVAAVGANPTSGNREVFIPPGLYLISSSLSLKDYVRMRGAGRWQTILKGTLTNASYVRSQYGESPSAGQRPVGLDLADFSIQCDTIGSGSIGINFKNTQYSSVRRVVVKNVATGAVTDQITQYTTWEELIVQVADTGVSFASTGGGNELFACHIAGNDTALDILSGTWDISCTTAEALASDTAYCIRLGRSGGDNTTVHVNGVYVEGTDAVTISLQVEDSVTRSAVRIHRHNTLGSVVNNAGTNCVIEVPGQGYYNPLERVQRVEFAATIDGSAQGSIRSNGSNALEARNAANTGYADWYLNTLFTTGTPQTLTGAGAVDVTSPATHLVTTGANALTLANGIQGQFKVIIMQTDGGDGTLTPSNFGNGTTITFNDAGDSAFLYFTNSRWYFMGGTATVA